MTIRYIGMLVVGALAEVLSGFMWLIPNGLMGGGLGLCLAAGAIWLGRQQQKPGGELGRRQIVGAGLVCGLLAGVLMTLISDACAGMKRHEFSPPLLPFWAPLLMGILYGVIVQWTYSTRLTASRPLAKALFSTCLACFGLKTLAAIFYVAVIEKEGDPAGILIGSALLALFGAVPFALFWVLAMRWTDPAWASRPAPVPAPMSPAISS